jgi:hypothetical protein
LYRQRQRAVSRTHSICLRCLRSMLASEHVPTRFSFVRANRLDVSPPERERIHRLWTCVEGAPRISPAAAGGQIRHARNNRGRCAGQNRRTAAQQFKLLSPTSEPHINSRFAPSRFKPVHCGATEALISNGGPPPLDGGPPSDPASSKWGRSR